MGTDDDYIREMIQSIQSMTQQMVEFRQHITRAMTPLYPRIVEIEKQLDNEAKERPARQKKLDELLSQQNAVASQQGAAIQQTIRTLNEHGEILQQHGTLLERIYHWQFWGRVFDVVLIGGLVVALLVWWLR